LISKKISLKKRKVPLSTQEVYTRATRLAHKKTHKKLHTHNIQNPYLICEYWIITAFNNHTNADADITNNRIHIFIRNSDILPVNSECQGYPKPDSFLSFFRSFFFLNIFKWRT